MKRPAAAPSPLFALFAALGSFALLSGCGGDEKPEPPCVFGVCEPGWHVLYEGTEGAVLSVSPDVDGRLRAVGGPLGNAEHDLVLTQDDDGAVTARTDLTTASHWWLWNGPDGTTRMVGEGGEIWRLASGAGAMSAEREAEGLTEETLFGVWGPNAADVWAVGGSPLSGGEKDVLLHFDGTAWARVTVPEPKGIAFYKVWGHDANGVWICGQQGWMLRIRGGAAAPTFKWYRTEPGRLVFTVAGNDAGAVWAVATPGGLYHFDDTTDAFEVIEPPFLGGGLNGVSVAPGGEVWVVGSGGTKWQRKTDGTWVDHTLSEPRGVDLHAVYATDDGVAVVGGHFNDPPQAGAPRKGVLAVFNGR